MQEQYPLNTVSGLQDSTLPWTNGNAANGTIGSVVQYQNFVNVSTEVVNVIATAGLTPTDADLTQLYKAIARMIEADIAAIPPPPAPPAYTGTAGVAISGDVATMDINSLSETTSAASTDFLPILHGGVDQKIPVSSLATAILALGVFADGNMLVGLGAPAQNVGLGGDWWFDVQNFRIYGPKAQSWLTTYIQLTLPPSPNSYAEFALANNQTITANVDTVASLSTVVGQSWATVNNGTVTINENGNYSFDCEIYVNISANGGDGVFGGGNFVVNNQILASMTETDASGGGNNYFPPVGGVLSRTMYLPSGSTVWLTGHADNDEYSETSVVITVATMNITKVG